MQDFLAVRSGASLVNGNGSADNVQEKLLLYYKMTGVELIRPMRLDGETLDQAKDRVLKETAVLDSDRKADLLKQYAKESLQWASVDGDVSSARCAIVACTMCGLRDPEQQRHYHPRRSRSLSNA